MRLLILLGLGAAWLMAPPARAEDTAAACKALKDGVHAARFAALIDAPTTILTTNVVPAGGDGSIVEKDYPEICRVEGQIAPTVGFLLRMPTKSWNGKFMMGGCGGPCGEYLTDRVDPNLVAGYAVVVTDMGHKGQGWMFGYNNIQGVIDFGFRSTHVTAVAAKDIIDAFYGKHAARNYYRGCSTGGRQGMVEAQRFPDDFDGIIAGAPPWSQTGFQSFVYGWWARNNTDQKGKPILSADKLPAIHKAVMDACDAADGLKDDVLQDPRKCNWDPKDMLCKSGNAGPNCLTPAEAEVLRKVYEGPRDSKGRRLFYGQAKGSELEWHGLTVRDPLPNENSMTTYLSYFYPAGPTLHSTDTDLDRDPPRWALTDWAFKHTDPDLRRFNAVGGKLILYHGWSDNNNIPPEEAIQYYESVAALMGGLDKTRGFFRLFMAPAMWHCRYGNGGGEMDWTTALENWVEKGQAPDSVIAYHMVQEPYPSVKRSPYDPGAPDFNMRTPRFPLEPGSYDRARPVYAFPDVARYSGNGDPALPTSWEKAPR